MTHDHVRLSIPAEPRFARLLRLTVASIAGRVGFNFDEVEDVRIAVSEASALLLGDRLDPDDHDPDLLDTLATTSTAPKDARPTLPAVLLGDLGPDPVLSDEVASDHLSMLVLPGDGHLDISLGRFGSSTRPHPSVLSSQIFSAVVDSFALVVEGDHPVIHLTKQHQLPT